VTAISGNALISSVTSNPSNNAVVAARWTSGNGMEMAYFPDFALGYIQNTYPVTSGQPYGDIYFRQNVGGTMTTRMTIKADGGNVGIGTPNPANQLTVIGNDPSQVSIEASSGNINAQINLKPAGTGIAYIKNQANTDFAFGTNNAERMRIASGGNVLIGTATDVGAKLHVNGGARFTGSTANLIIDSKGNAINFTNNGENYISATGGSSSLLVFETNSTERMRLQSNGVLKIGNGATTDDGLNPGYKNVAISYNTSADQGEIQALQQQINVFTLKLNPAGGQVYAGASRLDNISDQRMKTDIEPITNALEKVKQLTGKKFHLIDEQQGKIRYGFIAQDLEGVLDDFIVNTNMTFKNGEKEIQNIKSIESWASSWAALLVEAIKELKTEIDSLKN
jgi:hypothetical protein